MNRIETIIAKLGATSQDVRQHLGVDIETTPARLRLAALEDLSLFNCEIATDEACRILERGEAAFSALRSALAVMDRQPASLRRDFSDLQDIIRQLRPLATDMDAVCGLIRRGDDPRTYNGDDAVAYMLTGEEAH
ncbi:hypothetical protein [Gemmobacter sp.]|uniref:hypothetical protein n=1 Tax=Gemmobacter sp. TaxID=1898957 RepID=UPI002AFDD5C7|nr:hypothetical protein [Gemmobacter sp.]